MQARYKSWYRFDVERNNFINALINYNKMVNIISINGVAVPKEQVILCKDLADVIKQSSTDEMKLICESINATSTIGVFPSPSEVLPTQLIVGIENTSDKESSALAHSEASKFISYLQAPSSFEKSPDLAQINKSQAVLLVNDIHQALNLTGVLHLALLQQVILQLDGVNYLLKYGNESSLTPMAPLGFDLDDGFRRAQPYTATNALLANLFRRWQNNNYQGSMIPAEKVGFEDKKNAKLEKDMQFIRDELLADYQRRYPSTHFDNLLSYVKEKYATLNMTKQTHHFFEHCILNAAGCLPLPQTLRENIHLKFNRSTSNLLLDYPGMSLYLGIPDEEFFIESTKSYDSEDNTESPIYKNLNTLVYGIEFNLNDNKVDYAIHDEEHLFYRKKNLQFNLILNLEYAQHDFITNPLFIAQFLIENASKIDDKSFIKDACQWLISEINKFRDLKEGVPSDELDKLAAHLNSIYNSHQNQSSVVKQGLFSPQQVKRVDDLSQKHASDLTSTTEQRVSYG